MLDSRVAYWREEFERLKAIPPEERTPTLDLVHAAVGYQLGQAIAAQNGNWPAEEGVLV